jgi:hypothetical protein
LNKIWIEEKKTLTCSIIPKKRELEGKEEKKLSSF